MSGGSMITLKEFKKQGNELMGTMQAPILLSLNLKNFKYFNQIYGEDEGDKVLEHMKEHFCYSLTCCIMSAMSYVDHMCCLVEAGGIEDARETIKELVRNFVDETGNDYPLAKLHLDVGVYVVDKPEDENFADALDNARYARRSINSDYRSSIAIYKVAMRKEIEDAARVIPVFEYALEHRTIELYFQPKFAIDSKQLIGAELLSRIFDQDGNILMPSLYIPILEESGLISHLDEYIIDELIVQMLRWEKEGWDYPVISVNLSRVDFLEPGMIERIDRKITEAGLPKDKLEFELTETTFCENFEEIVEKIEWMRNQKYRISMDDFGTGYNCLDVLGTVPVDVVKFDRAFVVHSLKNPKGIKLMEGLIQMFQHIDFDVICEGVETAFEEELVYRCGCNAVQGFLYDKPIRQQDFETKYLTAL